MSIKSTTIHVNNWTMAMIKHYLESYGRTTCKLMLVYTVISLMSLLGVWLVSYGIGLFPETPSSMEDITVVMRAIAPASFCVGAGIMCVVSSVIIFRPYLSYLNEKRKLEEFRVADIIDILKKKEKDIPK